MEENCDAKAKCRCGDNTISETQTCMDFQSNMPLIPCLPGMVKSKEQSDSNNCKCGDVKHKA